MSFTNYCINAPSSNAGKKITQVDAHSLVHNNYWLDKLKREYYATTDSCEKLKILNTRVSLRYKKCLFESILSDSNCVGIRIYFARDNGKEVLVLIGYDKKGNDLAVTGDNISIINESNHDARPVGEQTFIAEVGGGDKLGNFWEPTNYPDCAGVDGPRLISSPTPYEQGMIDFFTKFMNNQQTTDTVK